MAMAGEEAKDEKQQQRVLGRTKSAPMATAKRAREQDDVIADVGAAAQAFTADDGSPLHEIESLCMLCGENVVLMAFEYPHCYERNNEVQFAGQLQAQGCALTLKVPAGDPKVLNRQVVKSDSATELLRVEEPWTLVLDDALANSFIAPLQPTLEATHS